MSDTPSRLADGTGAVGRPGYPRAEREGFTMHVRVLGPIEVESGGEVIAASANQRLLVAVLAAHAGHVVSSDLLAESIWGDASPRNPAGALQNLVSRLRARLEPDDLPAIETRPPGYGLALGGGAVLVDRREFELRVAAARREPDPRRSAEDLRAALDLWRGPAYGDLGDVPALRGDAVRLQELRDAAQEHLLRATVQLDPAAAVAELEVLVDEHPYRDGPHMLLMEALYRSHRKRDALQAADRYRTMLVEELGLDPSPALRELEHAILSDSLDRDAPGPPTPARSGPTRHAGNLPSRRSSFVGRERDVEEVGALLDDHPLVSLVGVGGAGKTSLGIEVARRISERDEVEAWVVDLVGLRAGGRIAELVASTVAGTSSLSSERPVEALAGHLADRELVLVLDNCEHLVDDAAHLVDVLLARAPRVRLLATSREPLRVDGECVHRVDPLAVPAVGADVDGVLASPSGRLFVDRVLAADSGFVPEPADAPQIAAICRRLDGLPLALEIAAARVPAVGLAALSDRLDDRFGLLENQQRSVAPHHRTLRAAIAWSVDLLDPPQRALLARLSVFAGSFDLEAAEAVGSDAVRRPEEVPAVLAELVERSLVVSFRTDGLLRYRLLETVREHVDELLGESRALVRRRHRDWYLGLAKRAGDGFLVQTASWSARLRADFPNLRAAHDWSIEQDEVSQALDLVASLRWALFNTGHLYGELRSWIDRDLLVARRTRTPPEILGRGLVSAGSVAGLEGRSLDALALLEEALGIFETMGADEEITWCEMWLGAVLTDLGHYADGVAHAARGVAAAEASGVPATIVYLSNQHAENALAASILLDDPAALDVARSSLHRAIEVARGHGIEEGLVRAEHGLAVTSVDDDPTAAYLACIEALDRWRALGGGLRLIIGLVASARVAARADEVESGVELLVEACREMDRAGWHQPFGRLLDSASHLALQLGCIEEAAVLAGGASVRFLSPRWLVDLEPLAAGRPRSDPARWAEGAARGASLDDASLAAIVSELARRPGAISRRG